MIRTRTFSLFSFSLIQASIQRFTQDNNPLSQLSNFFTLKQFTAFTWFKAVFYKRKAYLKSSDQLC